MVSNSLMTRLLFMTFAEHINESKLFTNTYRNYNFQVIKMKFLERIALLMAYSKK